MDFDGDLPVIFNIDIVHATSEKQGKEYPGLRSRESGAVGVLAMHSPPGVVMKTRHEDGKKKNLWELEEQIFFTENKKIDRCQFIFYLASTRILERV